MTVTRHYASVHRGRFGARQVHYRRAGHGPAVLLLHQSPMSSRELLPLMERWRGQFTLIAPDTPGYGCSDAFGRDEVTMEEIADGVVEFLDALGIERIAVYGFHTGAMIATALATRHPRRLSCAVANGCVVLDAEARADLLANYLPRFEPRWDGSHLCWLWARMREQSIFFPWYRPSRAGRIHRDVPAPAVLQESVLEFLRAGDQYRIAYRAAFAFDGVAALRGSGVPTLVTAASQDPLHAGLAHLQSCALPATVELQGAKDSEHTLTLARSFIARHPAPPPPAPVATQPIAGRLWSSMVSVRGGQLHVRRNDEAAGRTVLLQHAAGAASEMLDDLSLSLSRQRPVLAIDRPGHGESDDTLGADAVNVERQAEAVLELIDALGLERVDFVGIGDGGLAGLELASRQPARIATLVISEPAGHAAATRVRLKAQLATPLIPDWYGGHLLMCWHMLRDQGLFRPWFERTHGHVIDGEPQLDPQQVHRRVVNFLKAGESGRLASLASLEYPAAGRHPHLQYCALPDDPSAWNAAILRCLDR